MIDPGQELTVGRVDHQCFLAEPEGGARPPERVGVIAVDRDTGNAGRPL